MVAKWETSSCTSGSQWAFIFEPKILSVTREAVWVSGQSLSDTCSQISETFSLVLLPGHGFPLHVPCSLACLSNALAGSLCLEQTVQRLAVPRGFSGSDRGQPCFPLTHISHRWLHTHVRFVRYLCVFQNVCVRWPCLDCLSHWPCRTPWSASWPRSCGSCFFLSSYVFFHLPALVTCPTQTSIFLMSRCNKFKQPHSHTHSSINSAAIASFVRVPPQVYDSMNACSYFYFPELYKQQSCVCFLSICLLAMIRYQLLSLHFCFFCLFFLKDRSGRRFSIRTLTGSTS